MAQLQEIADYCNELLAVETFDDYCPNGLQIEATDEVRLIVSGVTASQALIDAAVAAGAQLLLVHHGYFWRGEDPRLIGMKGRRIRSLIQHNIALLAYHLPLDAHREFGNNAQLAIELGFEMEGQFLGTPPIAGYGRVVEPIEGEALATQIGAKLGREPLYIPAHSRPVTTIAWCSGAAQGDIEAAAARGYDAYLTGEVSEQTVHVAREMGIHLFAAGHHATERYGVRALARHLAQVFNVEQQFIDIDNPA